jgi:hypothetical protein
MPNVALPSRISLQDDACPQATIAHGGWGAVHHLPSLLAAIG